MARIELSAVPEQVGTRYPAPHDEPCKARRFRRLGDAAGLTRLGATRLVLPPGAWSSQRHWHTADDEFVVVLEGEVVLVTDAGEELLRAGDCCAFKAGVPDGHCAQNRSNQPAVLLAVSSKIEGDGAEYPDVDLRALPGGQGGRGVYVHKDGTPY